jgi:hypothetical protein
MSAIETSPSWLRCDGRWVVQTSAAADTSQAFTARNHEARGALTAPIATLQIVSVSMISAMGWSAERTAGVSDSTRSYLKPEPSQ